MSTRYKALTAGVSAALAGLRTDIPETLRGFSALAGAALKDGALSKKQKELIAMAIAVASRCDACIGFHAEACVKLGVTRAEYEEMLGVAVYMGGGPSLMYAAEAMDAWAEFGGAPAGS